MGSGTALIRGSTVSGMADSTVRHERPRAKHKPQTLPNSAGTGQFPHMADQSEVRCPACGHRECFSMPENACVVMLDCPACGERLRPKPGDCCVFCSYGSTRCPPTQT